MRCSQCGAPMQEGAVTCADCGRAVQDTAKTTAKAKRAGAFKIAVPFIVAAAVLAGIFLLGLMPEEVSNTEVRSQTVLAASADGQGIYGVPLENLSLRAPYTQLAGDGTDTVTVMVYMLGSDLESEAGCASADLEEMLQAVPSENVNVVLETGGTASWNTDGFASGEVQRWLMQDGVFTELENRGTSSMLTPEDLSNFVSFAAQQYPANRNILLFWDHGGGSLYGFGSDELFPNDVLYLPDIAQALETAGVKFDIVGFDACLMGTMETAYMLEPYADYLVASEELEPGTGWYYTDWLTQLGENPAMDSVALGAQIVDDFIAANEPTDTLSVVSLRELPHVYETLTACLGSADAALNYDGFRTLSTARANAKLFNEESYDLVDLVDFVQSAQLAGGDEVVAAVQSAVKYRADTALAGVNGLSLYFPYRSLEMYGYAKDYFSACGMGEEYFRFYDSFVNVLASGQENSNALGLMQGLTGTQAFTSYADYAWYNPDAALENAPEPDYTALEIVQQGENWVLPLTEQDWEQLTSVHLQVMLDDGEGYIDLGSDQMFELDENDNPIVAFDNTWVSLDGRVVPYYAEQTLENADGSGYAFTGYVPAYLNGEEIQIMLRWDSSAAQEGYVEGYRFLQGNAQAGIGGTVGKGLLQLKPGDTVEFTCDYYAYDGTYDQSYILGEPLEIGSTMPQVTYEDVGEAPVLVCLMLTDIYQNQSWTESVEMS